MLITPASVDGLTTIIIFDQPTASIEKTAQAVTNPPNSQTRGNPSFEYTAEVVFGGIAVLFATIIMIYLLVYSVKKYHREGCTDLH